MPCTGNSNEPCGAGGYITVYRNNKPAPQVQQDANGFQYLGCYSDSQSHRSLTHPVHNSDNSYLMTVNLCTNLCKNAGYGLAGLEYGGECWCDNVLADGAQLFTGGATDNHCDMSCPGDGSVWCGGKDRLSLYTQPPPYLPSHTDNHQGTSHLLPRPQAGITTAATATAHPHAPSASACPYPATSTT
jgi:hypothetical protein